VKHVEIRKKGITRWFYKLRKNLYKNSIYFALLVPPCLNSSSFLFSWRCTSSAKYIEFLYKFFPSLWNLLVIPFFLISSFYHISIKLVVDGLVSGTNEWQSLGLSKLLLKINIRHKIFYSYLWSQVLSHIWILQIFKIRFCFWDKYWSLSSNQVEPYMKISFLLTLVKWIINFTVLVMTNNIFSSPGYMQVINIHDALDHSVYFVD
jgi:hypothetical protein